MSDLEPCPFCGRAVGLLRSATWVRATCAFCEADGPTCDDDEDAIAAWNRRAPSADHVPDTGKMVAPPVVKDCLTTQAAYAAGAEAMRERAAEQVDCGCSWRADALAATNKGERFVACGNDPCGAIEARAIRALPLPAGGSGWRPIETAPRDGESILCYAPETRDRAAVRRSDYWWIEKGAFANMRPSQPYTHWQPLPAAPEEGDEFQG